MSKFACRVQAALFVLVIAGLGLASALAPDRAFSPMENRGLAARPAFSLVTLFSGEFARSAEAYLSDQFIGRDDWIALKACAERAAGKRENNGVYFGARDTLLQRVEAPAAGRLAANVAAVNRLGERLAVPVYFTLVPTAACVWADRLPTGAPSADQPALIAEAYAQASVATVDTLGALIAARDEYLYYRTDHHWTSLGAYVGARALAEAMDLPLAPLAEAAAHKVSDDFYGTLASHAGARWIAADEMWLYVPEEGIAVTAHEDGEPVPGQLYDMEKFAEKDKYAAFLGGNQPLTIVRGPAKDAPKALFIRDSYASSEIPFLTGCLSEIHAIDPRYFRSDVAAYVAEHELELVIVSYSLKTFLEDGNLVFLSRLGA